MPHLGDSQNHRTLASIKVLNIQSKVIILFHLQLIIESVIITHHFLRMTPLAQLIQIQSMEIPSARKN
jgi:hypothetical protein